MTIELYTTFHTLLGGPIMDTHPEHAAAKDLPSAGINDPGETCATSPCEQSLVPVDGGTAPGNKNVCTAQHAFNCETGDAYNVATTQFDVQISQLIDIFEFLQSVLAKQQRPATPKQAQQPNDPKGKGASN